MGANRMEANDRLEEDRPVKNEKKFRRSTISFGRRSVVFLLGTCLTILLLAMDGEDCLLMAQDDTGQPAPKIASIMIEGNVALSEEAAGLRFPASNRAFFLTAPRRPRYESGRAWPTNDSSSGTVSGNRATTRGVRSW